MTPGIRRFPGGAGRLRSPERLAVLEVPRVVGLCLEGLAAASVLDVGTGAGVFAEAFAPHAARVAGVDPNEGLLDAARGFLPDAELRVGTAEALPFPDGSFDLVFFGVVLHEVDDPAAAMAEARRVARRRVAVLEWPHRSQEVGPPLDHRLETSRIQALARSAGLRDGLLLALANLELHLFAVP
jgi:ubiquinone/menaquinone biosynthesis C-methylase UbiE